MILRSPVTAPAPRSSPAASGASHGRWARGADALELADRLRPLLLKVGRHMRRELGPLGVTPGQVTLLATIRDQPGIGMRELAQREKMSAPSMVGHVDRLEALGLVARSRGAGDRRRVGLSITATGQRLLRGVRWRRTAWLADRLDALDPAELAALDAAVEPLRRLVEGGPERR